jgi:hypothetical protein
VNELVDEFIVALAITATATLGTTAFAITAASTAATFATFAFTACRAPRT